MNPESLNSNKSVYESNNQEISSCFLDCFPCFKDSETKSTTTEKILAKISKNFKKTLENSKKTELLEIEDEKKKIEEILSNVSLEKMIDDFLYLIAKLKPQKETVDFYVKLIDDGPIKNECGMELLHLAALSDNELLIKHMLESNKKIKKNEKSEKENANSEEEEDEISKLKNTSLHWAAKVGAKKAVACLIENGAHKEAKDYLGRTPLYLAAEYGQEETVKLFIEKGCEVNVKNKNGQKALYWIIAKCRNLAVEILDGYRTIDKYYYIETYNLKAVELELMDINKVPTVKSILELIVEQYDSELITHPVIKNLIEYKWNNYYFFWPVTKFIFDLLFCVSWNLWSVLIPYNERHIYNFPQETWRIILFVFGILGVIIIIIFEFTEFYCDHEHKKKITKTRSDEIDMEEKAYPCIETRRLIENERNLYKKKPFIDLCYFYDRYQQYKKSKETNYYVYTKRKFIKSSYSIDGWDMLDLLTIILIITSLATHLEDILNHSETVARNHIRVASITVVVLSFRLLKSARTLWMPFGMLVMTLYHIIKDIIVWILAFIIIWIPFTTCFYMLFGNGLTIDCDSTTQTCSAENKTVISGMENYSKAAFFLFTAAFGAGNIPYEQFNELDDKISNFIVGLYIGVTAVIMVNIFIALLSSTFERVHDYSKGVFLIERAKKIIQVERCNEKLRANRLRQTPLEYKAEFRPKDRRDDFGLKNDLESVSNSLRTINKNITLKLSNIDKKFYNQNLQINQIDNSVKVLNVKLQQKMSKNQVDVLYVTDIEDVTGN